MFSWLLGPVPRFLYKYVPQDRWDIVQNLQIRFTQFYDLNDLFEAQGTYYDAEIKEVEVLFPYWYNPMGTRIPIDGLKRNVKIRARVPLAGWRSQSLQELKYIWKEQVDERLNYLHASLPRLGVLSLAAAPDNPTMWTHYCGDVTEGNKHLPGIRDRCRAFGLDAAQLAGSYPHGVSDR